MIIVTGVGRCGTSTVARILHERGICMGHIFQQPDSGNPLGYFEDWPRGWGLMHSLLHEEITVDEWRKATVYYHKSHNCSEEIGYKHPLMSMLTAAQWDELAPRMVIWCRRDRESNIRSIMTWSKAEEQGTADIRAATLVYNKRMFSLRENLRVPFIGLDFSVQRDDAYVVKALEGVW